MKKFLLPAVFILLLFPVYLFGQTLRGFGSVKFTKDISQPVMSAIYL